MQLLRLLLVVGVLAGTTFFVFGRSLWHPAYTKLRGAKSVAEVVETLRQKEVSRFDSAAWTRLVILGLKEEQLLEVWGVAPDGVLHHLKTFPFTASSGRLGPKLREGDRQIPEGLYRIEYLNPNSSYHLSIKIDYPNAYDRRKALADGRDKLGGDIFIHGRSVTIGCIPIGDPGIEELFFMVAQIGIKNVSVIIAPFDMRTRTKTVSVDAIDWEDELYAQIKNALHDTFPQ